LSDAGDLAFGKDTDHTPFLYAARGFAQGVDQGSRTLSRRDRNDTHHAEERLGQRQFVELLFHQETDAPVSRSDHQQCIHE
jgi:hypothetical protein